MGCRKKKRVPGSNETCAHCGKWAVVLCEYCKRPFCRDCARRWTIKERLVSDGKEVTRVIEDIITCLARKCQAKISPMFREQSPESFKADASGGSDFEEWA